MRIKLHTSIAGTNFSHKPGDTVNWTNDAEATRLVESGQAEALPDEPQTADATPTRETADATPTPSRKRRGN